MYTCMSKQYVYACVCAQHKVMYMLHKNLLCLINIYL